jgi:hypothetical protein
MKRFLVCVLCSAFLFADAARADDETSKLPHYLIGTFISDEKIARALAETLIREKHGEAVLKENQPLTVRRDGEFWVVEGKVRKMPLPTTIKISSVDARVDVFIVSTRAESSLFVPMTMPNKHECGPACHKMPEKQ